MNHLLGHLAASVAAILFLATTMGTSWAADEATSWRGWEHPMKRMPEVDFDVVPLSEVVEFLQEAYDHQFDAIVPEGRIFDEPATLDPSTGLPLPAPAPSHIETGDQLIDLKLRNVTATEVFKAMNLLFEEQRNQLQWDLVMNGERSTAVLRVLDYPVKPEKPPPPPPRKQAIFFVGDLIGPENPNDLTMESLREVIVEVWFNTPKVNEASREETPAINYHEKAELLIMLGTEDEINSVTQTLKALKDRAEWNEQRRQSLR